MSVLRRATAAVFNVTVTLVVLAAPPWALLHFAGNPFPRAIEEFTRTAIEPLTLQRLAPFLTILMWVLWLLLVSSVVTEAVARVRGMAPARWVVLRPVQGLAAALVAGQAATILAPAATAVPPVSYIGLPANAAASTAQTEPPIAHNAAGKADPSNSTSTTLTSKDVPSGVVQRPMTILVGDTSYVYIVKRGDWMSKIAKAWLGDADRWREICELNRHRHFPQVGGTLRDCDIIYPGWELRLPADARPPAQTTPAQPSAPPPAQEPEDVTGNPPPSPPATISPPSAASPSATGDPAAPTAPAASADRPADDSATTSEDQGVRLPDGSWVTWTLAAAIMAAAALVWLQRRRRFTVDTHDDPEYNDADPPTELPPVVQLRHAIAHHPELTLHPDEAEQAAAVPELAAVSPGGIGLQGDGAPAAARAAIVAMLASGGPHHPDDRGEVVIDTATLTTLLGSDPISLGAWPRLNIADNIDDALTIIEAHLLHRSRILDEHQLTDLDTLRQEAPYEEALPPILLVTNTPPPGAQMRTKTSLALGAGLNVSAILLGQWPHGATVEVTADGHTTLLSGQPTETIPPRLPVLQAEATTDLLSTLREAHTGQLPAVSSSAAPGIPLVTSRTTAPATTSVPEQPTATDIAASDAVGNRKAKLRVLGTPRIEDITEPGRDLRSKARELAVFLACHPDGASTRDIGEYLEPDARLSQADQRVHTNASNLRHVLGRAGSADAKAAYVIKSAGRYRLDPATVQVDIWQLRDLLRNAAIATGQRRRDLLTQAGDLYTAPLAEGTDYEWITPHRETVRRWGTEAHLLLADDLLDTDPHTASSLLDKAIGLDPYNESLYRKAMHARHALGDTDGIRTLLRALTKALADLDAEPEEETITLATTMRNGQEHR